MPQLRLTIKMQKELKVIHLQDPTNNPIRLYDDWYVDIVRIMRRKIFIFMHINTRVGLAIPSYEIGGAQNLLECFPLYLREFFSHLNYEEIAIEAYNFFNDPQFEITFTKTDNKSILRHITTFKNILEFNAQRIGCIDQLLCDKTSEYWLDYLIKDNFKPNDYTTPLQLIKDLFDKIYN